jgi:hypothetical protein
MKKLISMPPSDSTAAPAALGRLGGGRVDELAQEAEVFRVALCCGLLTSPDVASWADAAIHILGSGDPALVSVAAAGRFPTDIVSRLLCRVQGPRSTARAVGDVLLIMHDHLERDPGQSLGIATALDRLAATGLTPDLAPQIGVWAFSRRLQAALRGESGSAEGIIAELRDVLTRHLPASALVRRAHREDDLELPVSFDTSV